MCTKKEVGMDTATAVEAENTVILTHTHLKTQAVCHCEFVLAYWLFSCQGSCELVLAVSIAPATAHRHFMHLRVNRSPEQKSFPVIQLYSCSDGWHIVILSIKMRCQY
jgi:hypothetical protein